MQYNVKSFSQKVMAQIGVQVLLVLRALLILPIISKTQGVFYYGLWSQIIITITLLASVLTLRFDIVFVRYFSSSTGKDELRKAFSAMFFTILLVFLPVFLIIISYRQSISYLLFDDRNLSKYIIPLCGLLGSKSLLLFCLSYYRSQYRIGLYSAIQAAQVIGEIAVLYISIVVWKITFLHSLLMLLLLNALITLAILISILHRLGLEKPDFFRLKPYLIFGLPLIPNVSLQWIVNFSDRYLITHLIDLNSAGLYAASYSLGHMVMFFIAPIAFVLYPTISKLWEDGKKEELDFWTVNSLKMFLLFGIPSIFGLHHFAPSILQKLATEEFTHHRMLVILIAGGYLFLGIYQIFLYLLHLKEKTTVVLLIFIGIASANVLLNLWMIPVLGIEGAAIATLISYSAQAVLVYAISHRYFHISIPIVFAMKSILSACLMYGFLLLFQPGNLVRISGLAVAAGLVYFICMILMGAVGRNEYNQIKKLISREADTYLE